MTAHDVEVRTAIVRVAARMKGDMDVSVWGTPMGYPGQDMVQLSGEADAHQAGWASVERLAGMVFGPGNIPTALVPCLSAARALQGT
jgi:hypothetical protein